jgi:hypothetical protein
MKVESSGLSDCFLPRFAARPRRWREQFNVGDLGGGQSSEQIRQIIKWVKAVPPATTQQGINHGTAFPGFRMPEK